jgi:hypothetical protein
MRELESQSHARGDMRGNKGWLANSRPAAITGPAEPSGRLLMERIHKSVGWLELVNLGDSQPAPVRSVAKRQMLAAQPGAIE